MPSDRPRTIESTSPCETSASTSCCTARHGLHIPTKPRRSLLGRSPRLPSGVSTALLPTRVSAVSAPHRGWAQSAEGFSVLAGQVAPSTGTEAQRFSCRPLALTPSMWLQKTSSSAPRSLRPRRRCACWAWGGAQPSPEAGGVLPSVHGRRYRGPWAHCVFLAACTALPDAVRTSEMVRSNRAQARRWARRWRPVTSARSWAPSGGTTASEPT